MPLLMYIYVSLSDISEFGVVVIVQSREVPTLRDSITYGTTTQRETDGKKIYRYFTLRDFLNLRENCLISSLTYGKKIFPVG